MGIRRRDTQTVPHPPSTVLAILRDGGQLAQWNPAFGSSTGHAAATVGSEVRITVKGLPGMLTYEHVALDKVSIRIHIPGLTETSTWWLEAPPGGTRVTHELQQTGPLARLLEPGTRDVATLRLDRLARRLERPTERIF